MKTSFSILLFFILYLTTTVCGQTLKEVFNRGITKCNNKDYSGAISDFTIAIKIDPSKATCFYNRGLAKSYIQDYRGAISDFTSAIERDHNNANYIYNRGAIKRRLQDFSGAVYDFTIAINIDPKDAEFYYNRGEAKFQLGQNDSGCIDFGKAEELGSKDASEAKRKYCHNEQSKTTTASPNRNPPKSNISVEFKTYQNADRRFKIDYPSFLTIGDRAENDDGRDFKSDGGEICLWAYSSYNMGQSISELFSQELQDKNFSITYKIIKSKWYVVSGINNKNGKEFYKKVYFSDFEGNQIRTMEIEYPQSKHSDFDVIITRLVQSFKDI